MFHFSHYSQYCFYCEHTEQVCKGELQTSHRKYVAGEEEDRTNKVGEGKGGKQKRLVENLRENQQVL